MSSDFVTLYYFVFFSISLVLGVLICIPSPVASRLGDYVTMPFLLVFLLMISTRILFGDSLGYRNFFYYSINNLTFSVFEPGFELYTAGFARFTNWTIYLLSFPVFLLLSSLNLYATVRSHTNYRVVVFTVLCWPFFMAYSTTGFRQSLAIAVGFLAIAAMIRKSHIVAGGLLFGSTLFHSSAVLLLVTIIVGWKKLKTKWFIVSWVISIALAVSINLSGVLKLPLAGLDMVGQYGDFFDEDFGLDYKTGIRLDFVFFSAIPLFAFFFRNPSGMANESRVQSLFRCYLVLNTIANLFSSIPYSDRVYSYSWLIAPVLLASVWEDLPQLHRILISAVLLTIVITYSRFWLGI